MTGAFPSLIESAEFSRRAVTLGFGAAFALASGSVRAAKGLSGFHDVRVTRPKPSTPWNVIVADK